MAKSTNKKIQSLIIDHAVNVFRYTKNVVYRMIATLNRSDAEIFAELQAALADTDSSNFKIQRLEGMLSTVRELNKEAYASFDADLGEELKEFTSLEVGFQQNMLAKTVPEIVFPIAQVTPEAVYAAAMSRPFQGSLLSDFIAEQEQHKAKLIRRAVADGYTQNKTTDQIVREIRGTKAKGYSDGIIEVTRHNAEAVVRTAVSHTQQFATEQVYKKNRDLIKEYEWLSTLDLRTTSQCQVRDGKRYTAEDNPKPIGHQYEWGAGPGRLHWQCRSTKMPVTKSWKELGVDIEEFSPGGRASMDGVVPEKTTYEEWLRDQPADRQDEVLGETRGALFRDGGLSLEEIYSNRGEEMTLEELRKSQASAFKRAGL